MLSLRIISFAALAAIVAAPLAFAQQPPNPQLCNAAINAVVAQRNAAMDNAANQSAQLVLVTNENEDLKKQLATSEKARGADDDTIADLKKQLAALHDAGVKP